MREGHELREGKESENFERSYGRIQIRAQE